MMDGTSASTPLFAGISAHALQGRRLGWINPHIYNNSHLFFDVLRGNNSCRTSSKACCGFGYVATKGWDPISGMGTLGGGAGHGADDWLASLGGANLSLDDWSVKPSGHGSGSSGSGSTGATYESLMIGLGVGGGGLFALILVAVAGVVVWHRRHNQTPRGTQEEEAGGDHGDLALSSITPNGGNAAGTQDRGGTGGETVGDIDRHGRLAKLSTERNAVAEDAGGASAFSACSPWGGEVEEQRGEGGGDSVVYSAEGGAEAKSEKEEIP